MSRAEIHEILVDLYHHVYSADDALSMIYDLLPDATSPQPACDRDAVLEEAAKELDDRALYYKPHQSDIQDECQRCAAVIRSLKGQQPAQTEQHLQPVSIVGMENIAPLTQAQINALAEQAGLTQLVADLREYVSNPGYSHQDYADTMRDAADAIAAYSAKQGQAGLTDDEILDLLEEHTGLERYMKQHFGNKRVIDRTIGHWWSSDRYINYARAAIAAHVAKGNKNEM